MIFCEHCLKDIELIAIIRKNGQKGNCPICGAVDVFVYDSDNDKALDGIFDNLLSIYTPVDALPKDYPKEDVFTIQKSLKEDWSIFADIDEKSILDIVKSLSIQTVEDFPEIFTQNVGVYEKYDKEYLLNNSILKTQKWEDFVESVKHKNRFHTNYINMKLFEKYCLSIKKEIFVDDKKHFYRSRISSTKEGYTRKNMGAPPCLLSTDGRANSCGISRLYLTFDRETALHEIRTAEYDFVTIGTFKQKENIVVVDLKRINQISPFSPEVDCTSLFINREHLEKINKEISKTMRRGDSVLDYIPTQYICDFIMSIVDDDGECIFDGIEYQSAMRNGSSNLAIFYPEKFKCTFTQTYEITGIQYSKKVINK